MSTIAQRITLRVHYMAPAYRLALGAALKARLLRNKPKLRKRLRALAKLGLK